MERLMMASQCLKLKVSLLKKNTDIEESLLKTINCYCKEIKNKFELTFCKKLCVHKEFRFSPLNPNLCYLNVFFTPL